MIIVQWAVKSTNEPQVLQVLLLYYSLQMHNTVDLTYLIFASSLYITSLSLAGRLLCQTVHSLKHKPLHIDVALESRT